MDIKLVDSLCRFDKSINELSNSERELTNEVKETKLVIKDTITLLDKLTLANNNKK